MKNDECKKEEGNVKCVSCCCMCCLFLFAHFL